MVPGTTTALVRLEQFSSGAADAVVEALEAAREAGAERIVLDLRGNPGGYVNEAVGVASQFLTDGIVYVERNADGETTDHEASDGGVATDLPLVVLVDGNTASSSEIVSGALQDHGRATIVGETTFGTGTVLGEFELADGSALRVGTTEWLTPDGRRIWHEGIAPDVSVVLPDDVEAADPGRGRRADRGPGRGRGGPAAGPRPRARRRRGHRRELACAFDSGAGSARLQRPAASPRLGPRRRPAG